MSGTGGVAFYGTVGIAGEKDVAALQRRDKLRKQQRLSLGVAGGQGIVYGNARSVGHDGARVVCSSSMEFTACAARPAESSSSCSRALLSSCALLSSESACAWNVTLRMVVEA